MKKLLSLIILVSTISSANAYFRCNTDRCKELRLKDKNERLSEQLANASDIEKKQEMEAEIAEIKDELQRFKSKETRAKTASK